MSDTEIPTVTGRLVTSLQEAKALQVPKTGDRRTGVYLEAVRSSAADVAARAGQLLNATASYRNFVISSGCDVPPGAPLANLDALFQAIA